VPLRTKCGYGKRPTERFAEEPKLREKSRPSTTGTVTEFLAKRV
jgi:hypothetical protein